MKFFLQLTAIQEWLYIQLRLVNVLILKPKLQIEFASQPSPRAISENVGTLPLGEKDFYVPFTRKLKWTGWYMFEFCAHTKSTGSEACTFSIFVSYNNAPDKRYNFAACTGRMLKRIIFFEQRPKSIRITFAQFMQPMGLSRCRLIWLTPSFAEPRILHKIQAHCQKYSALSYAEIKSQMSAHAKISGIHWQSVAEEIYAENLLTFPPVEDRDYDLWLDKMASTYSAEVRKLKEKLNRSSNLPKISILMPVFNADSAHLMDAVFSVKNQIYEGWELCIVDDMSDSEETLRCLGEISSLDPRIRTKRADSKGYIGGTTQTAFLMCSGDFIACLDQDDILPADALLRIAISIHDHPRVRMIYTDEDKIDAPGQRFAPHFKPDWNPDLLLSHNYINHLAVFEASRAKSIGGFRRGYEGSQDYDFLLRYISELNDESILHIPRVLYHWRATKGSMALDPQAKPYAQQSGEKALIAFARIKKIRIGVAPGLLPNSYRVTPKLPERKPLVSLLIPTRDRIDILKPCLEGILRKTSYQNLEVLVLDNGSKCKETVSFLASLADRDPRVRILKWDHAFNYSEINNFGAAHANGTIIGLVNNDIEPINSNWLSEMVCHAVRPEIGCVGAKLLYPDGSIQHAGVILGIGGVAGHGHKGFLSGDAGYFGRLKLVQNLSAVTGACLLVKKNIFEQVGGLDECNLPVAFNDVDFCLRVLEAGYRNLWTPFAKLYHHESASRGAEDTNKKQKRFKAEISYMQNRWEDLLYSDPAYNANLTLSREDFSLARQPRHPMV